MGTSNGWEPFEEEPASILDKAMSDGLKNVDCTIRGMSVAVNLESMTQYNTATKRKRNIRFAGRGARTEGMCKMGCGRKVAPGVTPRGHKFNTCCRGCATGEAE